MDHPTNYDKYRNNEYTITGRISGAEEHLVEDVRSEKRRVFEKAESKRKKHKRKSRAKGFFLTAMITLFCFSATLFAADLLSGGSGIAAYASLFTKKQKNEGSVFYAVYATHDSDMGVSYKNASVIRQEGGAGYVMKRGEEYYVILNAYAEKSNAEKVASRQANYGITEIAVPSHSAKKNSSLLLAEKYKDLYKEAYETLYQAANDLAGNRYGEEDMKRVLRNFKERLLIAEANYAEDIRGKEDTPTIEFKVCLAEFRSAFENLLESSSSLVADARYYAVMILHTYSLFANKYYRN